MTDKAIVKQDNNTALEADTPEKRRLRDMGREIKQAKRERGRR